MAYIIYSQTHGPVAYVEHPSLGVQLVGDQIAIPCESGADVNDRERWAREAEEGPSLAAVRENKKQEIRIAHDEADTGPCRTEIICTDGKELVIQYGQFDRDIWAKSPIGTAMDLVMQGVIQLGEAEMAMLLTGSLPPTALAQIKDRLVTVRDYYNEYHQITVQQMLEAAWKQNRQVEMDLRHKWGLEGIIDMLPTVELVQSITWETDVAEFMGGA